MDPRLDHGKHSLNADDYSLILEEIASRLGISYIKLVVILSVLPAVLTVGVQGLIVLSSKAWFLVPDFLSGLAWRYPGILSILVSAIFAKRLRDKAVTTLPPASDYALNPDLLVARLSQVFAGRRHVLAGLLVGVAAGTFQIIVLILVPWHLGQFGTTCPMPQHSSPRSLR